MCLSKIISSISINVMMALFSKHGTLFFLFRIGLLVHSSSVALNVINFDVLFRNRHIECDQF